MSKEAMKKALDALVGWKEYMPALFDEDDEKAITDLREALAEQRTWVGLTDEEVLSEAKRFALGLSFPFNGVTTPEMFARAIEAKLKEKNT
jgi:hypothetical protein